MNHTAYAVPVSCKGIVIEDGRVWLRRNERGEWELPGGKLDPGEQPTQTVAREMREELGVEVEVGRPVANHLYVIGTNTDEQHGVLVAIYACTFLARVGEVEHIGEAGKAEFKTFALDDIPGLNMPEFYKAAISGVQS